MRLPEVMAVDMTGAHRIRVWTRRWGATEARSERPRSAACGPLASISVNRQIQGYKRCDQAFAGRLFLVITTSTFGRHQRPHPQESFLVNDSKTIEIREFDQRIRTVMRRAQQRISVRNPVRRDVVVVSYEGRTEA